MSKALAFGLAAMFFYAAQNVIIDHRLTKVAPIVTLTIASGTIFVLSLTYIVVSARMGNPVQMPPSEVLIYSFTVGGFLFLADLNYFKSFSAGIPLTLATTLPICIPAFAVTMRWAVLDGGRPNLNFYLGIITAGLTLYLMTPRK